MRIRSLTRTFFLVALLLPSCGISYVQIATAEAPPLEATMISLDHQNFLFIYLSVAVNRFGEGISTLTKANFRVTENGVLQTDYFDVTPPAAGGGVRVVDIPHSGAFCLTSHYGTNSKNRTSRISTPYHVAMVDPGSPAV